MQPRCKANHPQHWWVNQWQKNQPNTQRNPPDSPLLPSLACCFLSTAWRMASCQPRGQCASVDDVHGASSECNPLIYCSHNSHSLSNYSVDISLDSWPWDSTVGYELSNGSNVHSIASVHSVLQKRCRTFSPLALSWSFLYIVQDSLLLENLPVITEWISSQTTLTSSLESLSAIASIHSSLEVVKKKITFIHFEHFYSNYKDDNEVKHRQRRPKLRVV